MVGESQFSIPWFEALIMYASFLTRESVNITYHGGRFALKLSVQCLRLSADVLLKFDIHFDMSSLEVYRC